MVLLAVGTFIFAYYGFVTWKSSEISRKRLVLLMIFTSGLVVLYDLNQGGAFTNWDEFSHWGTLAKLLESENTFHLKQKLIRYYFEDYPPGTALFSYFFLKGTGYSESVIYFAHSLILVAGCLPAIGLAMTVSYMRGFLAIVACYLLIVILGQGWSSALIDQIVGVLFGGIICSYWLLRDSPHNRVLVLIPALCFLVLSKQSGSSFALLITALIAVDRLWMLRTKANFFSKANSLLLIAPIWIVPKLIQTSWIWHVNTQELNKTFSAANLAEEFSKFTSCCHTDRELVTIANFFQAITGAVEPYKATAGNLFHIIVEQIFRIDVIKSIWVSSIQTHGKILFYFSALLLLSFLLHKKSTRSRLVVFSGAVIAVCLVYSATLLVHYLYVFSEYEGRIITSHVRYLNTYWLGLGLFAVSVLLSSPANGLIKKIFVSILATGLLFHIFARYPDANSYLVSGADKITPIRMEIRKIVQPLLLTSPKNSNVFLLWQSTNINENGPEFWMMNYEIRPRNTNTHCFSLGKPQYDGDVWTCQMNEQEVRNAFGGYHYVVVGSGVASLRAQYPQVFALAPPEWNSGIFEVFKDGAGKLALRPLQSSFLSK
ncbi:MAG: hypothetical protein A3I66_20255 [Burkholderiales bacterium RIFCSPLOWO2_02_FULL_57_36]|nr:MAG: hypothetical protein A3I66_20255 [Burkholderiales bacterium RIFCSPLOWO2_02_FULL_57_36]